jgi:hypothetical protein
MKRKEKGGGPCSSQAKKKPSPSTHHIWGNQIMQTQIITEARSQCQERKKKRLKRKAQARSCANQACYINEEKKAIHNCENE